jgi:hypothetical protein
VREAALARADAPTIDAESAAQHANVALGATLVAEGDAAIPLVASPSVSETHAEATAVAKAQPEREPPCRKQAPCAWGALRGDRPWRDRLRRRRGERLALVLGRAANAARDVGPSTGPYNVELGGHASAAAARGACQRAVRRVDDPLSARGRLVVVSCPVGSGSCLLVFRRLRCLRRGTNKVRRGRGTPK